MTQTIVCPWCGSANIETGDTLLVQIVKNPARIYYDVGLCRDCGRYSIHDGRDGPAHRVTQEQLMQWKREGSAA